MNHSQVSSISEQTFNGLANLEVLYLQNNNLKEIVGHEFASLLTLRQLHLQNNQIVRIAAQAFENLPMLNYLRLDGNLITNFPIWTLASTNPFLNTLDLSENMWSCDCSFAKPFRTYIQTFADRVVNKENLRCVTDNLISQSFLDDDYVMCPDKSGSSVSQVSRVYPDKSVLVASDNLVTILVSVVVAAVVLLAGICAICCFRHRIKTWLYSKSSEIYESRCSSIASENHSHSRSCCMIGYRDRAWRLLWLWMLWYDGSKLFHLFWQLHLQFSIYPTSFRVGHFLSPKYHSLWPPALGIIGL